MTPKKELKFAYCLIIILLLVGGISYAAFPVKSPLNPVRKMFKCTAGSVIFTHKTHKSETGYGVSCQDCHHHHEEDADSNRACTDCHLKKEPTTVPQACLDCHEPSEAHHPKNIDDADEARKCSDCHHKLAEGETTPQACLDCHESDEIEDHQDIQMTFPKESDAFHGQCIGCHKNYGKGPVDCKSCHVM